jgi:tetratricopeptide (TPR) repeat protein
MKQSGDLMKTATAALVFALAVSGTAAAQAPAPSAYYDFLIGRHLDSNGDLEGAITALQRAAKLDPTSAEIPADLAGLYVRLNRTADALKAGEQALKNDPDNITANRVMGSIYASIVQSAKPGTSGVRENAERAVRYLERSDPTSTTSVQLLLGRMYVRSQAWDKAIALLTKLLDEEPGYGDAITLLVQAYEGAGRGSEAIKLLEDNPTSSAQLSIMLAELYEGEERWADAAAAYGRASERRPRDIELKVRWATALLSVGDTPAVEKARTVLKEVAAANPAHVRGLYLLVQAERTLANGAAAEATARKMIATSPNSAWGHYALALVLSDRRDYRGVIATLQPVVAGWKTRTDNGQGLNVVRLYEQIGLAHQGLKQYDKAIEQFEQARQIAPSDIRLARLEARALRENGELDRGVTLLENALKQDDRQPAAYIALAELYLESGRLAQALAILDRAAARLPGDTTVAYGIGNLLEDQEHYVEAERVFKRVLGTDPNHVQALNSLGYMLAERGERLQESIEYIKRALEIEPNNPAIIDSLGWAYFKLNQLDLAELHLRKAAAGLVTNSVIQDHLGDTLYKLGNFDEAANAWERALAGDGDSIERATIERKLKSAREKTKKK